MALNRTYEVVFIIDPEADESEVMRLNEAVQKIVTDQGGNITKTELMGRRQLAYEIGHKREGTYVLLEVDGSGSEIAELERRMRVNDRILRYMTIRVDEDRRRAEGRPCSRMRLRTRTTRGPTPRRARHRGPSDLHPAGPGRPRRAARAAPRTAHRPTLIAASYCRRFGAPAAGRGIIRSVSHAFCW